LYLDAWGRCICYDDRRVGWVSVSASMTQLAYNGQTQILQIPLARGEQVPITIDYELPLAATSGNQANVAERLASFDVLLQLGGDLPTVEREPELAPDPSTPDPTVQPDPTAHPDPDPTEEESPAPAPGAHPQPPSMPATGADLRVPAPGAAVRLALGRRLVVAAGR